MEDDPLAPARGIIHGLIGVAAFATLIGSIVLIFSVL